MAAFTVRGNHGVLLVGMDGAILVAEDNGCGGAPDCCGADGHLYANIARFDTEEWANYYNEETLAWQTIDILDLAYWCKDGTFQEAEADYRAELAKMRMEGH